MGIMYLRNLFELAFKNLSYFRDIILILVHTPIQFIPLIYYINFTTQLDRYISTSSFLQFVFRSFESCLLECW